MLTHTRQEARPAIDAGARTQPAAIPAGGARPSLGAVAQRARKKKKFTGTKLSLAEFLHPTELQPHRAFSKAETDGLGTARMLGHELTGNADKDERAHFQAALKQLKQQRRDGKAQLDTALRDNQQTHQAFSQKLDNYTGDLATTQVTNDKVLKALGGDYRHELDPARMQVKILKGDRHVATLHSGPSAFLSFGHSKSGRKQYYKRGDAPGHKTYVGDDFGVPTRRLAYAVKSGRQLQTLADKGSIVGRYSENRPGVDPLVPTIGELAELNYHTPGNIQPAGKKSKEEKRFKDLREPPAKLSASNMLYMHQEFGSSDRQRGVSATSTIKPLLANAGEGFAGDDVAAKKLVLDLGKVRKRRSGMAPELANLHHQIPGLRRAITPPALYKTAFKTPIGKPPNKPASGASQGDWDTYNQEKAKYVQAYDANVRSKDEVRYDADRNRQHLDWSTGKNREIFIRKVTPRLVAKQIDPVAAERFKPPPKP